MPVTKIKKKKNSNTLHCCTIDSFFYACGANAGNNDEKYPWHFLIFVNLPVIAGVTFLRKYVGDNFWLRMKVNAKWPWQFSKSKMSRAKKKHGWKKKNDFLWGYSKKIDIKNESSKFSRGDQHFFPWKKNEISNIFGDTPKKKIWGKRGNSPNTSCRGFHQTHRFTQI